jgi:hypothetical protein
MRRTSTLLLTTLLLTGCTAGQPGPGGSTSAPLPSSARTTEAPTTEAPTVAPATEATSPGPTGATGSNSTTRCHTADLKLTIAPDEGGGAAGTEFEALVFTNKSARTCTLYGYPGVSFVTGDNGTQVNDAFTRTDGEKTTVSLAPGAVAHASIGLPSVANFVAATCKPVAVRGFRVYPPDETAAVFLSAAQQACSTKGQGVGQVLPITR